jgi:hypothetical protein
MIQRGVITFCLACTACNSASTNALKPSATTVARIERKLVKDPCVATLAGTQRRYAYPWRAGSIDEYNIFVTFAVGDNRRASVEIHPPARLTAPEKSFAWGLYDIRNDRLTLSDCNQSA